MYLSFYCFLALFKRCLLHIKDNFITDKNGFTKFAIVDILFEPVKQCVVYVLAGQHEDARMCLAIALTAIRMGASCANYTECLGLEKSNGQVTGAKVLDKMTSKSTFTLLFGGIRLVTARSILPMLIPSHNSNNNTICIPNYFMMHCFHKSLGAYVRAGGN